MADPALPTGYRREDGDPVALGQDVVPVLLRVVDEGLFHQAGGYAKPAHQEDMTGFSSIGGNTPSTVQGLASMTDSFSSYPIPGSVGGMM